MLYQSVINEDNIWVASLGKIPLTYWNIWPLIFRKRAAEEEADQNVLLIMDYQHL